MTEDALKACQDHAQAALKKLVDTLLPTRWLIREIVNVVTKQIKPMLESTCLMYWQP